MRRLVALARAWACRLRGHPQTEFLYYSPGRCVRRERCRCGAVTSERYWLGCYPLPRKPSTPKVVRL